MSTEEQEKGQQPATEGEQAQGRRIPVEGEE